MTFEFPLAASEIDVLSGIVTIRGSLLSEFYGIKVNTKIDPIPSVQV